ncbi:MAG: amino acid transporter, partial [Cyclobacteriaceae bacterium]
RKDWIFPGATAEDHQIFNTPHNAILISGMMATVGILGSDFAGSFFLGIDIMVTAMLVNYLLMCITLLTIRRRNPELGKAVNLFSERTLKITGIAGTIVLLLFLIIHLKKDLQSEVSAWYFRSTWVYLIVMVTGLLIFYSGRKNTGKSFSELPD